MCLSRRVRVESSVHVEIDIEPRVPRLYSDSAGECMSAMTIILVESFVEAND